MPFWWFTASSLCTITVVWPVSILFWNFFAFKIYAEYEVKRARPKLTVALITAWSIVNCLFSACVDRELAHMASELKPTQSAATLAAYYGTCIYTVYYFLYIQKRTVKGEMSWSAWAFMAAWWVAMGLTFSTRPADIPCEHFTCVWEHP